MTSTRMRQAVLVAREYEPVAAELQSSLGLADPFHDPGVGHFGLRNGVFNPGRDFIEIVTPVRDGTTAGRFLDRLGADGGYMIMFQVPDADAARARLGELGVRIVWTIEHPDIVDLHLHPKDVPAAIVSLTDARPRDSWRWGGEAWEGAVPDHGPGRLTGLTVAATDPTALAARWAAVLDVEVTDIDGVPGLVLDDGAQHVRFVPTTGTVESIVGIGVAVPAEVRAGRDQVSIANVAFTLSDA